METKNTENTEKRKHYNSPMALVPIIAGIVLNYAGSKLAASLDLPIYLDNTGTIISAVLGGYLPGIITAVINNIINYALDAVSIYYASISALIAITTVWFHKRGKLGSFKGIISFIVLLTFIGGCLGGIITWFLSGVATEGTAANLLQWCMTHLNGHTFTSHIVSTFALDLIDKGITAAAALLILRLVPDRWKPYLWLSGWRQTPFEMAEQKTDESLKTAGRSLNTKIALMLIFASLSMSLVVTGVSSTLFRNYSKEQHFSMADGAARLAASAIDPEKVDEYLEKGEDAEGYSATEKILYNIRESYPDIQYVYVYKILEDGCHVVFDLDTEDTPGSEPGDVIEFDESFAKYVPALIAGEAIDPIETDDTFGWLLTVYEPVYNSEGKCVCYAAADVSVNGIREYEKDFIVRVILLFLGFFILILVAGLWLAKYNVILPVNSIAAVASDFAYSDDADDEATAGAGLERMNELRITTGDEIQALYESLCKMTADTVEHIKNIREQNESISRLQNGLIMTLADMVEGRDSDTGNHIRKTAAYVKIIMDGLRRKGYYTDQLTDKFVYDVERSAPLHDIGKIAVSDVILNKPGKLTDEEFEIMKTHTTAGKELLEKVIQTVEGESYLEEARNLAAYHHEKWNGKGYPEGLSGEDIPLSARIMAIADVFDALSSKRVYKDAMPFDKAVSIIKEDAGTHFDPKCAEAFLDSLDEVREVLDYYNRLEEEGENVRGNEI